MKKNLILAAVLHAAIGIAGCAPKQQVVPAPSEATIEHVATVKQVMLGLTIPASDVLFQIGSPKAPEDKDAWDRIVANAALLAESGNLLLTGPRDPKQPEWTQLSREFVARAKEAMAAAETRDVDAVLTAGNGIYEVCENCHKKYMLATEPEQPAASAL